MAERIKFTKKGVKVLIECNNMLGQKEGSWFPFRKDVINISFYRVMHRDPDALPELLTTIAGFRDKNHLGPRQRSKLEWVSGLVLETIAGFGGGPEDD